MEALTLEEIEDEKYRQRLESLLEEIKTMIIEADESVARGSTQKADKILKKIEESIVSFIMGDEIKITDIKKYKGKKI